MKKTKNKTVHFTHPVVGVWCSNIHWNESTTTEIMTVTCRPCIDAAVKAQGSL